MGIKGFFKQWEGFRKYRALSLANRSIVFYAEDGGSWRYFEPIIRALSENYGQRICYLTSSLDDPVLSRDDEWIYPIFIGSGTARTLLFLSIQADVMVMTMPDLQTYHLKRSKYPVHYVYVHHSMVSSHMAYRRGAFDHFDSIFCVGPHHERETRATEQTYNLKPKTLIHAGYGVLDSILETRRLHKQIKPTGREIPQKRVLVAPTWGNDSLLESCGREVVETLLSTGHLITVRPHSMSRKTSAEALADLERNFSKHPSFQLDMSPQSQGSFENADIMVTDWSGAALEFAFGLERPVIFVDLPKKINNQEYQSIPWEPIEVRLREQLGSIISEDRLSDLADVVCNMNFIGEDWTDKLRKLRDEYVYNLGFSGTIGAKYIAEVAHEQSQLVSHVN